MTEDSQSAASLVAQLVEAGTPSQLLAAVAQALFKAEAEAVALESRRANDRERQARRHVNSRELTCEPVKPCDSSLEVFPPPPLPNPIQEITPFIPLKRKRKNGADFRIEPPDWMPVEPWKSMVALRRGMHPKVQWTEDACRLLIAKVDRLRAGGHCPIKLLEKAVLNSWRTVFEADDTKGYFAISNPVDMDEYRDRLTRIGQTDATH